MKYTKPEVELTMFETADVLTTSCEAFGLELKNYALDENGNQASKYKDSWK